jgi:hypothetical protein
MRFVNFGHDANRDIPGFAGVASNIAHTNGFAWSNQPNKRSGKLVITDQFSQFFCGNIGFAHAFVLLKRWFVKWLPGTAISGNCANVNTQITGVPA